MDSNKRLDDYASLANLQRLKVV